MRATRVKIKPEAPRPGVLTTTPAAADAGEQAARGCGICDVAHLT